MDDSSALAVWLVISSTIGQTLFVAMWAPLGWWREWIGRALMSKSAALMVYLWAAVLSLALPVPEWTWLALFTLIDVGIWYQVVALWREKRAAMRQRRPVAGTDGAT